MAHDGKWCIARVHVQPQGLIRRFCDSIHWRSSVSCCFRSQPNKVTRKVVTTRLLKKTLTHLLRCEILFARKWVLNFCPKFNLHMVILSNTSCMFGPRSVRIWSISPEDNFIFGPYSCIIRPLSVSNIGTAVGLKISLEGTQGPKDLSIRIHCFLESFCGYHIFFRYLDNVISAKKPKFSLVFLIPCPTFWRIIQGYSYCTKKYCHWKWFVLIISLEL